MQKRLFSSVAILMLLATVLFFDGSSVTKGFDGQIRIGIVGPIGLPEMYPGGMWDGANLAANEINAAGGVNVGGVMKNIALDMGDEHAVDLDPAKAQAEVTRLITVQGDEFLIGGFRTEVTGPMIETAMDYQTPFFICGAATDELVSTTVPVNYARYKYLFRVTPINSTTLFRTMCAFMGGYLVPTELLPIYGDYLWPGAPNKQVKIGVLVEDLSWADKMWYYMTIPSIYPLVFGPYANVTYSAQIPDRATDYVAYTTGLISNGCRLVVAVFSGSDGIPLIEAMNAAGVEALTVGINVLGQLQSHWASTGGGCDYETMLAFAGTRTPIVGNDVDGKTVKFWDDFLAYTQAQYGTAAWPIYTAWGAYDAVYNIKEAIEAAGTTDADTLVPFFESTDRISLAGRFRYTSYHDVYAGTAEVSGPYATGNVRAMMVQWRNFGTPRCDVVWPIGASYSRMPHLTPSMYPLTTDINFDGKVDIKDLAIAAKAFGSNAGEPDYRVAADINNDGIIDISDIAKIAKDYGRSVTIPIPIPPGGSKSLSLTTNKRVYADQEIVTIILENTGTEAVLLTALPWFTIFDSTGYPVYPGLYQYVITYIAPGQTLTGTWNQKDADTGQYVPHGSYSVLANSELFVEPHAEFIIQDVRNPAPSRNGYRYATHGFPGVPWVEWWYFKLSAPNGRNFFFIYMVVNPWDTIGVWENTGAYVFAGMSYHSEGSKVKAWDKYSVTDFIVNSQICSVTIHDVANSALTVAGGQEYGDSIRIRGSLRPDSTVVEGKILNVQVNSIVQYTWNLTFTQVLGLDTSNAPLEPDGFGWLVYMMEAKMSVGGTITINTPDTGSQTFTITEADVQHWEGYQDHNWGEGYPEEWIWGQCIEDQNFSLVLGDGKKAAIVDAGRLGLNLTHGYIDVDFLVFSWMYGDDVSFRFGGWTSYTDEGGTWLVPTNYRFEAQNRLAYPQYNVTVSASWSTNQIERLPFPRQIGNLIFNDFEPLGVSITIEIYKKIDQASPWVRIDKGDLTTTNGGAEYGRGEYQ